MGNSFKKIKAGMVIATYYPVWGGAQCQLNQIGGYLTDLDVDFFILTRKLPGTKKHELISGVPVYRIFVTNRSKFLDSFLFTALSLFWLIRNNSKFDVLHCYQMYSPATIGVLAKSLLFRKKVVVKVTSSNEYGETNEIKRLPFTRIRLKLLKCVDRFLIVNNTVKDEITNLGIIPDKIVYVPNGVEVPKLAAFEDDMRKQKRLILKLDFEKIVIFTGRLTEEKNLEALLNSWVKVSACCPKAHLIMLGEGGRERDVEEKLGKLVLELNLKASVHMLGMIDNVFDYLLASDIFVLPSISEGLSNSLLEAMAAGLGIVAGDIDGNRQVIKHGENGILVDIKSTDKIASALINLINDPGYSKLLGQNARKVVTDNFSMEKIARKYVEIYSDCINAN